MAKKTKAAEKGGAKGSDDAPKPKRIKQIFLIFNLTRKRDRLLVPVMAAWLIVPWVIVFAIGIAVGSPVVGGVAGFLIGAAAMMLVFSRRAQASAYREIEGQPGAAAAVIENMRGDWRLTPNVALTRNQDVVHRVLGRPGVILIGEGDPGRVGQLLAQEKRRISRVASGTPMYEFQVGLRDGQVPLRKIQSKLTHLPRTLKARTVDAVEGRMRALGGANNVPMPKGPLPRNARMPKLPRGGLPPR